MSNVEWFVAVAAAMVTYFVVAEIWNRDNRGAVLWGIGVFIVAFLFLSVAGCSVSPERRPWMEVGVAYDTQGTVGSNPACVVRVRAPVGFGPIRPDWLVLGYTHHSSCPAQNDLATIDQIELVAKIPLGRD